MPHTVCDDPSQIGTSPNGNIIIAMQSRAVAGALVRALYLGLDSMEIARDQVESCIWGWEMPLPAWTRFPIWPHAVSMETNPRPWLRPQVQHPHWGSHCYRCPCTVMSHAKPLGLGAATPVWTCWGELNAGMEWGCPSPIHLPQPWPSPGHCKHTGGYGVTAGSTPLPPLLWAACLGLGEGTGKGRGERG